MKDEYKIIFKLSNGDEICETRDRRPFKFFIQTKEDAIEIAEKYIEEYNRHNHNINVVKYLIKHRQVSEWKEVQENNLT